MMCVGRCWDEVRYAKVPLTLGARDPPSCGMSETTNPGEEQAPTTQRMQCPFCLFTNEIATDAVDPLCLNCLIDMTRIVATGDGQVEPLQQPEAPKETVEPRPKKVRKPKRPKQAKNQVVPYVATPAAAVSDVAWALASPQVPPVAPNYGTAGPAYEPFMAPPALVPAAPGGEVVIDERMEATIVHVSSPRARATWVLEYETGEVIPLPSDDVVVGRHPESQSDATPVALTDPTRMLSRTHARLQRDPSRDTWTITDLGSSNGVATVCGDTGEMEYARPGVDVAATEYLLIGQLRLRLHRVPATRLADASYGVAS